MKGRFLTFEGIDGAGKSTHIEWALQRLRDRGIDIVATREPGGSALAEALRTLLLNEPMPLDTELLLMFAARRDHLEQLVRPALAQGRWVVCDRFTDSTYAYQGAGRGAAIERIDWLAQWVHGDLRPSRTWLFDLDPEIAARRRAAARDADRFETEDVEFFRRVRDGYLRRARAEPARILVIDGSQGVDTIRAILEQDIARLCSI